MNRLAADGDVDVWLVAPVGWQRTGVHPEVKFEQYPFYEPVPGQTIFERWNEMYRMARLRRALIDRFFDRVRPDCIVVISDTSRESVPFIEIARRHKSRVVFMQSVFLSAPFRKHVHSENWALATRRGLGGMLRLVGLRTLNLVARLPATLFKSSSIGRRSDAIFVINAHQKKVFEETAQPARIHVTGTPFLDHLYATVNNPQRRSRREFCRAIECDETQPLIAYFSKSLEQFCQVDPVVEKVAQEFFVDGILKQCPGATVVVKLHPIEDVRAFTAFEGHPRVRVVKDMDVHEVIHHSEFIVSLGPSTPAMHAIFHDRPRLIITKVDDIVLDYQQELLAVSRCVRSRDEYLDCLRQLHSDCSHVADPEQRARSTDSFMDGFDGRATDRVHREFRRLLELPS
jgi:hypothetical protein